jgi:hypothetical protein
VVMYLCFSFRIFSRPMLEEYVSIDPHLLQSCLRVALDNLPLITKNIHLSFESLVVIDASSL